MNILDAVHWDSIMPLTIMSMTIVYNLCLTTCMSSSQEAQVLPYEAIFVGI